MIPGLVLAFPLLAARVRPAAQSATAGGGSSQARALEEGHDAPPPIRARVVADAEAEAEELARSGRLAASG